VETQLGCQQLSVKQDMLVRWNSTKDMFERILQIKEPLISTLGLVNYEKNTLTLSDWQIIAYYLKALKVFQEITVDVSAEKNVTISKIIYLSRALLRHCRVMQEDPKLPVEVQNMVRKMQEQLIRQLSDKDEDSEDEQNVASSDEIFTGHKKIIILTFSRLSEYNNIME
jgi:hypothetical protein